MNNVRISSCMDDGCCVYDAGAKREEEKVIHQCK